MSGLKKAGLGAVVALLLVAGVAYLFLGSQYITKRIGGTTTIEPYLVSDGRCRAGVHAQGV